MKTFRPFCYFCWLLLFLFLVWLVSTARAQTKTDAGWPTYSNDAGGTRYSPARQIDRSNVTHLKVAWTYRTGAFPHDEELDQQYLVIAAGGHGKLGTKQGDYVIAFVLP